MGKRIKNPKFEIGAIIQVDYPEGKKYFRVVSENLEFPGSYNLEPISEAVALSAAREFERSRFARGLKTKLLSMLFIAIVLSWIALTSKPSIYEFIFFGFEGIMILWFFWYEIKYLLALLFRWLENQRLIDVPRGEAKEDGR